MTLRTHARGALVMSGTEPNGIRTAPGLRAKLFLFESAWHILLKVKQDSWSVRFEKPLPPSLMVSL